MWGLAGDSLLIYDDKHILETEFCNDKNIIDSDLPILVENENKRINILLGTDRLLIFPQNHLELIFSYLFGMNLRKVIA